MQKKPDRLSFRIPWLMEAVAEGPWAIATTVVLVVLLISARGLGWW